jgi:dihydrodiol dehydrogenase / D-xylose 1-dehydrogenase (NADP)
MKQIKWGIMGTGTIANNFVLGLGFLENAELYAVASRSKEKADEFGKKYNAAKTYGSYEEMACDKDIDVIYIATPNAQHKENIILCLNNDKAVLCEKPLTINAAEAEAVIKLAREKKLFLMEAMWSRFFPIMDKVRSLLLEDAIGEIRMVNADFGFRREGPREDRKYSLARAGGALLDVGVYPLSFASMVFGEKPISIKGITHLCDTGVDIQSSMLLGYGEDKMAVLSCSINTSSPKEARIIGNNGSILIPNFSRATQAILYVNDKAPVKFEIALEGNGYNYEAKAVMESLIHGKIENEFMPLDESLSIIKVMDELRNQYGLKYPTEK